MRVGVAIAVVAFAAIAGIGAQPAGFTRTTIHQHDLSTPGQEIVQAIAAFEPKGTVGWHTHPGEEAGFLLEGAFLFEVEGKPTVTLSAGQTFFVPPGVPHNATNISGTSETRVLATYIVEKGKPLATAVARR